MYFVEGIRFRVPWIGVHYRLDGYMEEVLGGVRRCYIKSIDIAQPHHSFQNPESVSGKRRIGVRVYPPNTLWCNACICAVAIGSRCRDLCCPSVRPQWSGIS